MESSQLIEIAEKTENAKKGATKQLLKAAGSLRRITDLKLSHEKIQLMEDSVLYKLVQCKNARQCSAPMDLAFCKFYNSANQCFVFNDKTSLHFCTEEVAKVLGIKDGGDQYEFVHSKDYKIPDFLETLKKEQSVQGTLEIKHLKQILQNMKVDDDERKVWFRKLLSYYVVDQLFMSSSNVKIVRKHIWRVVEDLETFEKINWAKIVYDNLHKTLGNLAGKVNTQGEHKFNGEHNCLKN